MARTFAIDDVTVASDEIGRAAATKLCRSVVVKGLESLLTESLLAARVHGVEREVLDSLPNILPPADWEAVAGYFISRSLQHGARRAEEMEEAAATVAEAGHRPVDVAPRRCERQALGRAVPRGRRGRLDPRHGRRRARRHSNVDAEEGAT